MSAVPPAPATAADRRLHPLSWLFVLLAHLKSFLVPLLVLLFLGRGDRNELWALLAVGVAVLAAVWRYATFRYGLGDDHLVLHSGLLERQLRVVPFARIHNVALKQSALHRLFGVAEVRLESASGGKAEADMRVLSLHDAVALEALIRGQGADGTDAQAASATTDAAPPLLQLPLGEVLRLGLVSNRGMVLLGAGLALLAQFDGGRQVGALATALTTWWLGHSQAWLASFGAASRVLGIALLLLAGVLVLRVLSLAMAVLQYAGFTLREHGARLTIERGLLARWRSSLPKRRIQAWTLRESLLLRWLGRRALRVDSAAGLHHDGDGERQSLPPLAPIIRPQAADALIERLLPDAGWPTLPWRAHAAQAWGRWWWQVAVLVLVAAGLAAWRFGPWAWLTLVLWLPALGWARRSAASYGYAIGEHLVAVRAGAWSRHWRFAERATLQVVSLRRNPLDRRLGTASVWFDTAGSRASAPEFAVRYLSLADAERLLDALHHDIARRRMRW